MAFTNESDCDRDHATVCVRVAAKQGKVNLSALTDDELWAIVDNPGIICREIERRAVEEKEKAMTFAPAYIRLWRVTDVMGTREIPQERAGWLLIEPFPNRECKVESSTDGVSWENHEPTKGYIVSPPLCVPK